MVAVALLAFAPVADAQRIQFASQLPDSGPYTAAQPIGPTPQPTLQSPPPVWDPYSSSSAAAAAPSTAPYAQPVGAAPYAAPVEQPLPASQIFQQPLRFLQHLDYDHTYLPRIGGDQGLGVNDDEFSGTFAIPLFSLKSPFLVTPGFALHLWDGPDGAAFTGDPSMPPQTYDAYLDTAWRPQVTERLSADLAVRVGVYSDFDSVNTRSLRLPSRALGVYTFSPIWQAALGIVYYDRLSVRIVPAGGLIWTPNTDTRYELIFPRPKLSQRVTTYRNTDIWGYVAGEYGGNTWTITRNNGDSDVVDYADLRLILGLDFSGTYRLKGNVEVGYIFNRRLRYRSGTPTADPDDTMMIRAGLSY